MALIDEGLFGIVDKEEDSISLIQDLEPKEGYYVAFSGGKDSVVILDLVKRAGVKFDAHYNITGIDPPELYYFIRDNFPEVQRHRPEITIWKLIEKKMMPPTRTVRYCCEYLKERGVAGRRIITGVRRAESARRSKRQQVENCFRGKYKEYVHPIFYWSDKDVWEYIHKYSLKYCHLYDEGFKRLGCIGCPMADKGRIKQFKRWPKYEAKYRKAFDVAAKLNINRLGDRTVNGPRWVDGDAMFDWWMDERRTKDDPDQTVMFE